MKLCFFGPEPEHRTITNLLHTLPRCAGCRYECDSCTDYDSFVHQLRSNRYDAIFVTENNANGMEGVIAARNLWPDMPIVWFSNDEGFGSQAYRLNADFFHVKPVNAHILEMALERLPAGT